MCVWHSIRLLRHQNHEKMMYDRQPKMIVLRTNCVHSPYGSVWLQFTVTIPYSQRTRTLLHSYGFKLNEHEDDSDTAATKSWYIG